MAAADLTAARVRELLHYDPLTGVFTRRVATGRHGCHTAGSIVGTLDDGGYLRAGVDGRTYRLHRLAWLYMTGEWPARDVDHRFRIKTDNRWSELRAASRGENLQNRTTAQSNSRHGVLGVSPNKKGWRARITIAGKDHNLGTFQTPEIAHDAYVKAKRLLHPFGML